MSKRLAPAAIISIAQHASPNVIGQMLDWRAQLIACSTVVSTMFSSNRPSIQGRLPGWGREGGCRLVTLMAKGSGRMFEFGNAM